MRIIRSVASMLGVLLFAMFMVTVSYLFWG